jgi:hypothetical protein
MIPAFVGMALMTPWVLVAQDHCFPATDSHEAQTFGILSAPLAFSGAGGSWDGIAIGLEAASLPSVSEELATPTTCRPGKGPENANPLAGFLRLRIEIGMGAWRFDAGWIPPVRVKGMRSNLVGLGIARPLSVGRRWALTPRAHLLIGQVRGPITCDDEALQDPASECFEGTVSNDRWSPNLAGLEVVAAHHGDALVPHLGLGWTWLRPRFQVDFTNAFGETDRRRVEVDLSRLAMFGGLSFHAGSLRLTGEGYYTVGDRVAGRVVARWPLGGVQ